MVADITGAHSMSPVDLVHWEADNTCELGAIRGGGEPTAGENRLDSFDGQPGSGRDITRRNACLFNETFKCVSHGGIQRVLQHGVLQHVGPATGLVAD